MTGKSLFRDLLDGPSADASSTSTNASPTNASSTPGASSTPRDHPPSPNSPNGNRPELEPAPVPPSEPSSPPEPSSPRVHARAIEHVAPDPVEVPLPPGEPQKEEETGEEEKGEAPDGDNWRFPYQKTAGGYYKTRFEEGKGWVPHRLLANAHVNLVEEIVEDDGAETRKVFAVEGERFPIDGEFVRQATRRLPRVHVPAAKFPRVREWMLENWGSDVMIAPTATAERELVEVIKAYSKRPRRRRVYRHSGWITNDDARSYYLTNDGAVGAPGRYEVDLRGNAGGLNRLDRYSLPTEPLDRETIVEGLRASLSLLEVASFRITAMLLGAMYYAPMNSLIPYRAVPWLTGRTGSYKSTLSALALSHYGNFLEGIDGIDAFLPEGWSSTPNALEMSAFTAKDLPLVVDDFAPQSPPERRGMEAKAERIIRSIGNQASRGRLTASLDAAPSRPPRALVMSTGESRPSGQGITARTLLVEMKDSDVARDKLTELQEKRALLRSAMAGYVAWLGQSSLASLGGELERELVEARDKVRPQLEGVHPRVPAAIAAPFVGLARALRYAEELGAVSASFVEDVTDRALESLCDIGRAQGDFVNEEKPTRQFLTVLSDLFDRGVVKLHGDRRHRLQFAEYVGWHDKGHVCIKPELAWAAVAQECRRGESPLQVDQRTLLRDLRDEGLSACDPGRTTTTRKLGGKTERVLKLELAALRRVGIDLLPGGDPDEDQAGEKEDEEGEGGGIENRE